MENYVFSKNPIYLDRTNLKITFLLEYNNVESSF